MASLTDALASMKNKNTQTTPVVNQRYQVQYINYSYLEESAYNFYPMSEIEELADAIELAGGILQPLLVRRKAPGQRYEIIAGHRRWTAAKYLVDQGKEKFAMLPCHVQDGNDLIARINLIITNSQREKSAYVKMQEVVELEQLLQELAAGSADERAKFSRITGIKLESENITARVLRKLVAKTAGLSETNVARLKHINSSLQPELKEVLEEGKIGISAADELARMAPEEQQEAAKQIKKGEKVQLPKKKITETTKSPNQEPKVVSVLDTEEQLPGQMNMEEYIPMPEPANAFELIEDEEQNAEQEVKKEEKKEESPTNLAMEEYIPMPEPANAFELIEDEEQNAEQEVKKEEKKEESPTNLANEYLALYQKTDAALEEWEKMHRRLADYFQQIR